MRVSIYTGNHQNSTSITDPVLFLKAAFQDCGFETQINPHLIADGLNIVIEHFVDDACVQSLLNARSAGERFILIGTEPIHGGSFNGGVENSHWHYSNTAYWKLRFDGFKVVAPLADAIWVMAQDMLAGYAALFPGQPVRFLPHGHVSDFASVRQRPETERDIDFFFSGSLTAHRQRILDTLSQSHRVVCLNQDTPEYLRQDLLSRSKVCLSLRLSPSNAIPSVSRMHFHLQNRSFLLHEAYELPCPLDPFVLQTPTEDLIPWALAALDLPNRRELANGLHDRFKAALPMSRLLPPLLDDVLTATASGASAHLRHSGASEWCVKAVHQSSALMSAVNASAPAP